MKQIYSVILGICLLTLSACDEVSEADRLIFMPPANVQRNIVIEDFTGQRCVNCPSATDEIHSLQQRYGDSVVIAVGIHSGPFGHRSTMTSPRLSLCTETGDEYYAHWNIEAQPGTLVNRSGGAVYDPALYAGLVETELARPTPVELHLSTALDAAAGTLRIDVEALSAEALDTRLQLWLVEDSIVDAQLMPGNVSNREYVHNHVFRASVTNDIYGDAFAISNQQENRTSYTAQIDEAWRTDHLSVVAFVYTDRDGILQAIRRPVVPTL